MKRFHYIGAKLTLTHMYAGNYSPVVGDSLLLLLPLFVGFLCLVLVLLYSN